MYKCMREIHNDALVCMKMSFGTRRNVVYKTYVVYLSDYNINYSSCMILCMYVWLND